MAVAAVIYAPVSPLFTFVTLRAWLVSGSVDECDAAVAVGAVLAGNELHGEAGWNREVLCVSSCCFEHGLRLGCGRQCRCVASGATTLRALL